ncbi:unnamed protein product [Peronospora farinosa]|uniref:Aldehyde dehydrogenase domain-containing protein n=1 Tax=Peronospora farinosa TaxID=134698 RepID=A0AAV0U9X2_9STRA|nr:unnamed protein product [Peronospora farinosa]CAI5733832.1 unnamed protein product [Peronospora farinosa]
MRKSHVNNSKRVTHELGGKSANIILDDVDIDLAIQQSQLGLFLNQGQCCIAGTRVFATEQGAQIDESQFEKILDYNDKGVKEGARLLTGSKRHGDRAGSFILLHSWT